MSWLLDHPDVHATELSDADTVSDEYSDEEVLEELEEAEPTFQVVHYFIFYFCHNLLYNAPSHLPLSLVNSSFIDSLQLHMYFLCSILASRCSGD